VHTHYCTVRAVCESWETQEQERRPSRWEMVSPRPHFTLKSWKSESLGPLGPPALGPTISQGSSVIGAVSLLVAELTASAASL